MKNTPAFPRSAIASGVDGGILATDEVGMTLLDYFAAKMMNGIVADSNNGIAPDWEKVAKHSYDAAEAMLKERESHL